jgi:hypothetical protein
MEAPGNCCRCDSPLKDGICTDVTCPFSDCQQSDPKGWIGHPDPQLTREQIAKQLVDEVLAEEREREQLSKQPESETAQWFKAIRGRRK